MFYVVGKSPGGNVAMTSHSWPGDLEGRYYGAVIYSYFCLSFWLFKLSYLKYNVSNDNSLIIINIDTRIYLKMHV